MLDESILDGSYGVNNPKENGGVYLISCGDYFKIGHSSDIKKTLSAIKTSNPYEVTLVAKYSPYKIRNDLLEDYLHNKFKEYHHRNEWFRKEFTEEDFISSSIEFYTEVVKKICI